MCWLVFPNRLIIHTQSDRRSMHHLVCSLHFDIILDYPSLYAYGSTQLIQMQQSVNIQLLRSNLVNTLTRYFYGTLLSFESFS